MIRPESPVRAAGWEIGVVLVAEPLLEADG